MIFHGSHSVVFDCFSSVFPTARQCVKNMPQNCRKSQTHTWKLRPTVCICILPIFVVKFRLFFESARVRILRPTFDHILPHFLASSMFWASVYNGAYEYIEIYYSCFSGWFCCCCCFQLAQCLHTLNGSVQSKSKFMYAVQSKRGESIVGFF